MGKPSQDVDLQALISSGIRETRMAIGWTQEELADRLGTNQSEIKRLEDPRRTSMDTRLVSSAMKLMGIRPALDTNFPAAAERGEQRDFVHARCCAFVIRQLTQRGWEVRIEAEIGDGRYRGWIDILAFRPTDRALLVIEVKTEVADVGRILRTLGWYTRSSREAATRFGWRPRLIVPALLALATRENDARISVNGDLLDYALPGGAPELALWMGDPSAPPSRPAIAMIDPRSRRAAWLIRTWRRGRRSVFLDRDYRDAATRLRGRVRM